MISSKVDKVMTKNNHLRILLIAVVFGALWGIVEATLGSILHIGVIADTLGIFGTSTAVILPIALGLMATCYKKSGSFRTVIYMAVIAVGIKAISCLILGQSFNACLYMAIEALAMSGACAALRPTKVFSWKTYGALTMATATFLVAFIAINGFNVTTLEKGFIAINYALIGGLIGYGINKAIESKGKQINLEKFIVNPITASVLAVAAITLSIIL